MSKVNEEELIIGLAHDGFQGCIVKISIHALQSPATGTVPHAIYNINWLQLSTVYAICTLDRRGSPQAKILGFFRDKINNGFLSLKSKTAHVDTKARIWLSSRQINA